jgi:predicted GNAT family acetyltransferase
MSDKVHDNGERKRFELEVEGHIAFSEYRRNGNVIEIRHTEVPPALGGKGVGSRLVRGLLDLIRAEGAKAVPVCPFVKAYIEKHPEYADLKA